MLLRFGHQALLQGRSLAAAAERPELYAINGSVVGNRARYAKLLAQLLLPLACSCAVAYRANLHNIAAAGRCYCGSGAALGDVALD